MVYFGDYETIVCRSAVLRICLNLSARTSKWISQFGSCTSERSSYK